MVDNFSALYSCVALNTPLPSKLLLSSWLFQQDVYLVLLSISEAFLAVADRQCRYLRRRAIWPRRDTGPTWIARDFRLRCVEIPRGQNHAI